MSRRPALQRGLSLIELLLGLAIMAMIMAPLVPMLETASAAARIGGSQAALEQEADFALERIAARIRATDPVVLSGASADWLTPAVYVVVDKTLFERQGGNNYPLAEGVSDFRLEAVAGTLPLIRISLALERDGNGDGVVDASTSTSSVVRMGGAR